MKKLFALFAVLLTSLHASAYDFEVDGIYYNAISLEENTCEVTYQQKTVSGKNISYTSNYTGDVVIPSTVNFGVRTFTVTKISDHAFSSCNGLTSVEIPNSVTEIGDCAFAWCCSLTSVDIPNSVTSIGQSAFNECTSLKSVVIGSSVNKIGSGTFYDCINITEIISLNPTPPVVVDSDAFCNVSRTTCYIYVPAESLEAYQTADVWRGFWNIVGIDSGMEPEKEKCAAPTISIADGRVTVRSSTEGAKCRTSITSEDIRDYDGAETIELYGLYKITAYAYADGYLDSDPVTKMMLWDKSQQGGDMTEVGDINGDGVVDVMDVTALIDLILSGK